MVMHNSLYKLSWKWLSSITKMGEIERTCGAPMFGFGNWWQSLWTNGCLELYLKVLSIGFSWSTCVGFKESLCRPRCYSRNYQRLVMWVLSLLQACLEEEDCVIIHVYLQDIIQMKRVGKIQGWSRLSQEWIKLINSQSVEDVPRGIKWSHGMVSIVNYALCTNPWSSWEFFVGLGCGVQVQVKHHEEIKCLKLAVHCGDNGLVKMCGRVAHP